MVYSEIQKRAVLHKEGPLLVLAGPGSGKTAVITARTVSLIQTYNVTPSSILVVTFTRAAAREMKERFLHMTDSGYTQVTFGTFHGIFFGILKQAYGISHTNILGEGEKMEILRSLLLNTSMEIADEGELLESLNREISLVKNNRIALEHYYSGSCPDEIFRELYERYHQVLKAKQKLDFDDLLVCCYELFKKRPDICKGWQKKFGFILVDEFQDINQIQYDIIKMLAAPENNLFIVGDDDQSIYRFRGAKPEIMLQFPKDFPGTETIILNQNYRSTQRIVSLSQRMIENNRTRFEKKLMTENVKGDNPEIQGFDNMKEESLYLVRTIQKYRRQGCEYRDMAVLFRTNTASRLAVSHLMEYHIPFIMRDTLPNLYEHWIARNMISYMRLCMGKRERKDFLMIMNRPNRYISREALYEKELSFESLYQFYEEKEWMCERIELLERNLKEMARMSPFAAINFIRYGIGYDDYLKEYAQFRKIKAEELYDLLNELQESTKPFKRFDEWFAHIERYTEELKQQAGMEKADGITVSTFHSVKGLEFKKVFILDVNEGMIPYHKAVLEEEVEEERRIFYVGMTRAKEHLHLFYTHKKYDKAQEPSRFINEITGERRNDSK